MNVVVILAFISSMVFLFLSVYSLWLNFRADLNRIFALFAFTMSMWALGYSLMFIAPNVEHALQWRQFAAVGYCLFSAAFLHFAFVLTERRKVVDTWWFYLLYLPAGLFLLESVIWDAMSLDAFIRAYGVWVYINEGDFSSISFNLYVLTYTVLTLGLLINWYSKDGKAKKVAGVIVFTLLLTVVLATYTDLYLPQQGVAFPPVGVIFGLVPASAIWWAITKHKLLAITPAYAAEHILATMVDPVFVLNMDGQVQVANAAAEHLLGYGRQELLSLKHEDLCAGGLWQQIGENNNLNNVEARVKTKDNRTVPVLVSSTLITDDFGQSNGVVCVLHDISQQKAVEEELRLAREQLEERVRERTKNLRLANMALEAEVLERWRAEEEIRRSEERLRILTDNMLDMIAHIDMEGKFLYASPSHKAVLGYEIESLLGRCAFDFIHSDNLTEVRNFFASENGTRSAAFEIRLRHANGRYVWLESVSNILTDEKGRKLGAVVTSRDITQRRQMEEQLKYLSLFDALTGLYNRYYFEQEMNRMESGRSNPVGIIICDVDGLKLINDSLGHEAGDRLLKDLAQTIKGCFRSCDVVARVGGDEFAVLLPRATVELVQDSAHRVEAAVAKYNEENQVLPVSISLGYRLRENNEEGMAEVFRLADDLMYREKMHRSKSVRSAVSQIMKRAMEERDFITEGQAKRVQEFVVALATEMGLSEAKKCDLRLLAQFHDIGKVGIKDQILFKPKTLSAQEWREMQRHCEIGHRIALSAPDLAPIADWILKHHEWWNGNGYPFGLKGEAIPLECRILSIADAYDAMTSNRPYRQAMEEEQAVAELRQQSGIQFDPHLVELFTKLVENGCFCKREKSIV